METLRGLGSAVGDYVGNGQGESETVTQASTAAEIDPDADVGPSIELDEDDDDAALETSHDDDAHPLLFFYDCESTGFSVYSDNITDIAAKVVACPVSLQTPTFSSLVRTSRRIPTAGKNVKSKTHNNNFFLSTSYQGHRNHNHHVAPRETTL